MVPRGDVRKHFATKDVEIYKKKLRFDCGLFLAIYPYIV